MQFSSRLHLLQKLDNISRSKGLLLYSLIYFLALHFPRWICVLHSPVFVFPPWTNSQRPYSKPVFGWLLTEESQIVYFNDFLNVDSWQSGGEIGNRDEQHDPSHPYCPYMSCSRDFQALSTYSSLPCQHIHAENCLRLFWPYQTPVEITMDYEQIPQWLLTGPSRKFFLSIGHFSIAITISILRKETFPRSS